ncbi:hypothetical protein [Streptosporangium sp. OZ121]|uniref:hypothetical protein n=1 Tax=Streptosporangium sp. OZ121 TaxID=3444183 RepID=UPI003F7AD1CF
MAKVRVKLDAVAIKRLTHQPGMAKAALVAAERMRKLAVVLAPKREPRMMYSASITTHLEIKTSGPVAHVSADVDATKIEFGTNDTPRFAPLRRALLLSRIN